MDSHTPSPFAIFLVVASVGRVTVSIAILSRGSSSAIRSSSVLVTAPAAEPALLVLGLGSVLDVGRSGVAWQGVVTVCLGVVLVASPEPLAATRGVAVSGGGTETLLALVVAGQEDLEQDGDEEEEAGIDVRIADRIKLCGDELSTYIPMTETANTTFSSLQAMP